MSACLCVIIFQKLSVTAIVLILFITSLGIEKLRRKVKKTDQSNDGEEMKNLNKTKKYQKLT